MRCPGCGQEFLVRGTPAAAPAPPPAEPTAIAEAVPLDFAAPMTPAPPPPPAVPERFRILRGVSWALAGLLAVAGGQ